MAPVALHAVPSWNNCTPYALLTVFPCLPAQDMGALLPSIAAACDVVATGGGGSGDHTLRQSSARLSYADIAAAAKSDVTNIKVCISEDPYC